MAHRFVIMIKDQIHEFEDFDDIPQEFDHVIEFRPEIPPPPHTDDQHRDIDAWQHRFDDLMRRERASCCSKN